MAGYDRKIIRDGFVAALVAFATIGGVGGSKLAAGEMPGLASEGKPEDKGSWIVPPLPAEQDRLQSIHAVLLPNGKVLMVNGSSNRNRIERDGTIQDGVSSRDYAVVNNTALFDPSLPSANPSGVERIRSPETPSLDGATPDDKGESNDPFCGGHVHLPDGNVLFVGGTARLYAGEQFLGTKLARVFDWQAKSWKPAGQMKDGHWYPSTVPLGDGRIAVFSGLSSNDFNISQVFSNSSWVEIYDPSRPYKPSEPGSNQWSWLDIRNLPNSPFAVKDLMDSYPRIYPTADGRLLITNDGGAGAGNIGGRQTYLAKIGPRGGGGPPEITFQRGPDLPVPEGSSPKVKVRKVYSSAVPDPNSSPGDFLSLGGMVGYEDTNIGPGNPPSDPATMRITADLLRYHAPGNPGEVGSWEEVKDFLGPKPTDVRIMHVATLLPTKQILVVGGGNYPYHDPLVRPILLTADDKARGGYRLEYMNPGTQPRLYHCVSLLLPDGRVFVAGGNPGRAARSADGKIIRLDTTRDRQGTYGFVPPGRGFIPVENWQVEIFSPPYLFKSGPRPEITDAQVPGVVAFGNTGDIEVQHATADPKVVLIKLGSVTHGWDLGQRLADLKFKQVPEVPAPDQTKASVQYTAPTNRDLYPPGYYMLFYVNNQGQPSIAKMVRLGEPS
ncbi:MAG: galactose oxidase early set domain-containing protein [Isosphaeraceae bacterium]